MLFRLVFAIFCCQNEALSVCVCLSRWAWNANSVRSPDRRVPVPSDSCMRLFCSRWCQPLFVPLSGGVARAQADTGGLVTSPNWDKVHWRKIEWLIRATDMAPWYLVRAPRAHCMDSFCAQPPCSPMHAQLSCCHVHC